MFDKWKSPRLGSKIILENSRVLLLPFESERRSELKRIIFDHDIWRYMGIKIETESDFDAMSMKPWSPKNKVYVTLLLLSISKLKKWLEALALVI